MAATEEGVVFVMYVGSKPYAIDNVAGTGLTWEGRGAVQPVPAAKAKKFLQFPDQWWPEGPVPTPEEVAARMKEFFAGNAIPQGVVLPKDLAEMDEAELVEYAFKEYGQHLKPTLTRAQLLEEISALEIAAQEEGGAAATVAKPRPRPASVPVTPKPAKSNALPSIDVDHAGKDRLEQYARTHLATELDQRKSLKSLRAQVKALIAKRAAKRK